MNKFLNSKKDQTNLIPKLSNTVRLLGEILGLVIKKQEGTSLFNKVENIRILSKASRGHKSKKEISKTLKLSPLSRQIEDNKSTGSQSDSVERGEEVDMDHVVFTSCVLSIHEKKTLMQKHGGMEFGKHFT